MSRLLKAGFFLAIVMALGVVCGNAQAQGSYGEIDFSPDSLDIREISTVEFTYTAGSRGIPRGGQLAINLPKQWFKNHESKYPTLRDTEGRVLFSAENPHYRDQSPPVYIRAKSSNPSVELRLSVDTEMLDTAAVFKDRHDRINRTFKLDVEGRNIQKGDQITLTFGVPTDDSPGIRAPFYASSNSVFWGVDEESDGDYEAINTGDGLVVMPGDAWEINVFAPSRVQVGEEFVVQSVALDRHFNHATAFTGTFDLSSSDSGIEFPRNISFEHGSATFSVTCTEPGAKDITVHGPSDIGNVHSNPIVCTEDAPSHRIYWGDLHSHDHMSSDARGTDPFAYARNVSGLDFYAPANHSKAISPSEWKQTKQWVTEYYEPGGFTTLLGFEASLPGKYGGHNNVYYRSNEAPYYDSQEIQSTSRLYELLEHGQALAIPHHPAVNWSTTDWEFIDDTLARVVEIYSNHGQSEVRDPLFPLSFEHMFVPGGSYSSEGRNWVRDAWAMGKKLGAIASSDDHRAQPGREHAGLVAVLAEENTRENVFDALFNRRTYATTGQRMVLDFTINGHPMGSTISSSNPPRLDLRVVGAQHVGFVEIIKLDRESEQYTTLRRINVDRENGHGGSQRVVDVSVTDSGFDGDAMYYARVTGEGTVRGRPVRGWSSPIWVSMTE